MAVSKIKTQGNYPLTKITRNYGIDILFKKVNGIRFLHVLGNPDGQIGTGGHTISLADTIVEAPDVFMTETQRSSASNSYFIQFGINKSVKIEPISSTKDYVNATFVY